MAYAAVLFSLKHCHFIPNFMREHYLPMPYHVTCSPPLPCRTLPMDLVSFFSFPIDVFGMLDCFVSDRLTLARGLSRTLSDRYFKRMHLLGLACLVASVSLCMPAALATSQVQDDRSK